MSANSPKRLEDTEQYCRKINDLLEQNSDDWQHVWKTAISELSSLASNEISVINSLLKPIESAFKSKDSKLRVQAFECWSFFITHCEKVAVSEKLWNVLLVPLIAHNHSVYIVLSAKLKAWHTLVDTSFITKPNVMKKAVPSILKCLYGPHTLDTACNFAVLSESCGQLYHKIMVKCSPFDDQIFNILSYLEKAIPPLSNMENTQKLAKLIWSEALRIISENDWSKEYFTFLMRTLENLFSDNRNDGFQLISNFLSILVTIYGSFPPDRLTPHLNLIIRCLFHPPINVTVVTNIMNNILKLSEKPSFFFHQLDVVMLSKLENDKNDMDKLWIAVASCYKKWVKNNSICESDSSDCEYATALKILLFPFDRLSEITYETEKFNSLMKHWKSCYEECAFSAGASSDKFIKTMAEKLETGIDTSVSKEPVPIPRLIMAIAICNTVLTIVKFSDGFIHIKGVLLKISENVPRLKTLSDSKLKSFAVKYIVTVLSFVKFIPAISEEFSHVIKTYNSLVPDDSNEVMLKVDLLKSDSDSDSVGKQTTEETNLGKKCTPHRKPKLRTSFLERLSPAQKKSETEASVRVPSTPKNSKIVDDDVKFVEIKPKVKSSPMTEHQQEMAKSKRYIPALYQDLSQSHSQSQCIPDSVPLTPVNKKSSNEINVELFEENANLPSVVSGTKTTPVTSSSLSFRSGLNSSPSTEKSASFLSKKSLFNDDKKTDEIPDSDCLVEKIVHNKSSINDENASDECNNSEKSAVKRKSLKGGNTVQDVTPVKRSRRLSSKTDNDSSAKSNPKSRKSVGTPISAKKLTAKSRVEDESNEATESHEVIDLVDTESQNIFLPTNGRTVDVSTPSSLMNLREKNSESNTKRKSLRAKKSYTPSRSPIPTRKRKSLACESEAKKLKDNNDLDLVKDSVQENDNSKKSKSHDLESEKVIIPDTQSTREKDAENNPSEKQKNISKDDDHTIADKDISAKQVFSPNKSVSSDSVILIDEGLNEVISIEDSTCSSTDKKIEENISSESKFKPSVKQDTSDESTFFEESDQNLLNKQTPPDTPLNENPAISDEISNIAQSNVAEPRNESVSPEIVTSIGDEPVKENNELDSRPNQPIAQIEDIKGDPVVSVPILEDFSTGTSNELRLTSNTEKINEVDVETTSNDVDESMVQTGENEPTKENGTSAENDDKQLKVNEENVDRNEIKDNSVSSPIHNSRASQIMMLACANNMPNVLKQAKTFNKVGKSPRLSIGKPQASFTKNSSPRFSRIMKHLQFDNEPVIQTTPNKIVTTPQLEKFKYTPKECTSPGILKKPDANQNTSSPKSPKIVNFADQLTETREYDVDSLLSFDGSGNLLNNDQLQSQDMLYSQLQNCRDDIKNVLEFIFSSAGSKQALDYFQKIGINTVGQLASMSTLTASSIPAGDNRIRRLRRALKKYDESISSQYESRGLRRPSARRKIQLENRFEVSCLIDLLNEAEPAEGDTGSDEETETADEMEIPENTETSKEIGTADEGEKPTEEVIIIELSEEKWDENDQTNLVKPSLNEPNKEIADDANNLVEAPALCEEKNQNIDESLKNKDDNTFAVPSNESNEPNSKSIVSTIQITDGCDEIESKDTEKHIIEETENKENVDPCSDVINVETASETNCDVEINGMEVDEHCSSPKPTSEVINESTDYVCTDSNTYEQNTLDRRIITMKNIHRYSTVMENEELASKSPSTETPSETVIVTNSANSNNDSISTFVENEIAASPERNVKSPEDSLAPTENELVESNHCSDQLFSDEISVIIDRPNGNWVEIMKVISPFYDNDNENAKITFLKCLEQLNAKHSSMGLRLKYEKIENM